MNDAAPDTPASHHPTDTAPHVVVAVDWSGDATYAARRTWVAVVVEGSLVHLANGVHPRDIPDKLSGLVATHGPRIAVGLDFAFGFPAWFGRAHGCDTGPDVWATAAHHGETWLRAGDPPFWGRPGRPRPPVDAERPGVRVTDAHARRVGNARPSSPFQIGGAGAVGTGSIRGMPILIDLRRRGFAIWPFDPPQWPRVVEIYPRHFTGAVVKSDPVARAAAVDRLQTPLPAAMRAMAIDSDDAFDAALTAVGMWTHRAVFAAHRAPDHADAHLEGAIWDPFADAAARATIA